jgi:hypothetical protein
MQIIIFASWGFMQPGPDSAGLLVLCLSVNLEVKLLEDFSSLFIGADLTSNSTPGVIDTLMSGSSAEGVSAA